MATTNMRDAIDTNDINVARELLERKTAPHMNFSYFRDACAQNRLEIAQLLIADLSDIGKEGEWCIQAAVRSRNIKIVESVMATKKVGVLDLRQAIGISIDLDLEDIHDFLEEEYRKFYRC